jgi:dienelactone hydrolase
LIVIYDLFYHVSWKELNVKKSLAIVLFLVFLGGNLIFAQSTKGNIVTETISYTVDGQSFIGLLAYDASSSAKRPGVIVVHEWLGINDYAKKRAVDLAAEGYVAFALDMYGDGKEIPMSEARSMSGKVGSDFPLIEKRFNAALDVLKKARYVDANNIAAIGYCFGGGIVLNMARMGTDINGVVSFHASINTGLTAQKGDIKTRILAIQGDGDPAAPEEKQKAFIAEMKESGADFSYIIFGNLPAHNFTNPDGRSYYEDEANLAWASMLTFFDSIFR